jgi:hypothetical protein
MSTVKDEILQLIEHHYFELENNKGISDALNEYSNTVNNMFFKIDEEVNKIITNFESFWLNELEKQNGISEKYLEFVRKEIEREITDVLNKKLEHWANVKC